MKKLVSVALALAMILSLCAFGASAEDYAWFQEKFVIEI